jgi:hypothetical protein
MGEYDYLDSEEEPQDSADTETDPNESLGLHAAAADLYRQQEAIQTMQVMDQMREQEKQQKRAEMEQGLKAGTLRFTPQQEQQLSRINSARAWINGADLPEESRKTALDECDVAESSLVPIPTPSWKLPPPPEQQISKMVYVDRDGAFGSPGATWIFDPKTKSWDVSQNAPNNQPDYGRNQAELPGGQYQGIENGGQNVPEHAQFNGPTYLANQVGDDENLPSGPGTGWSKGPAGTITATNSGYAPRSSLSPSASGGNVVSPIEAQGESRMWKSPSTGMWMTYDQHGRPKPLENQFEMLKQQQQQQEKQAALQAKVEAAQASQDAERLKTFNGLVDAELRRRTVKDPDSGLVIPLEPKDYEQARQFAMDQMDFQERNFGSSARQRSSDYSDYLKRKFVGTTAKQIGDYSSAYGGQESEEANAELQRRKTGRILAPVDWEKPESEPVPVGWIDKIKGAPPEKLQEYLEHIKAGRPFTRQEFRQTHPGENYEQYMQFYRWAGSSGGEIPQSSQKAVSNPPPAPPVSVAPKRPAAPQPSPGSAGTENIPDWKPKTTQGTTYLAPDGTYRTKRGK